MTCGAGLLVNNKYFIFDYKSILYLKIQEKQLLRQMTITFQKLFNEYRYLELKNYLYNYLLRKRAVQKYLYDDNPLRILEVGSGISALTSQSDSVVYSDISFDAIKILKKLLGSGSYVVADGTHLPFRSDSFSHAVCSEVLEHIEQDHQTIRELYRVLQKSSGSVLITVPHRKRYFSYDDSYVNHIRRYEIGEIVERLQSNGFKPILIKKVLGPLEKITMLPATILFEAITRRRSPKNVPNDIPVPKHLQLIGLLFKWSNIFYRGIVWLDAQIMPLSMATVILIKSITHEKDKIAG